MHTFTDKQRAFLLHGTRTGKLATIRADGRPHVVPIWFQMDGDTLVFTTEDKTVKAKNIRHNSHISICVDDETPPYAYMMIEGTASFSHDTDVLLYWATRIGGRYMGEDLAETYGRRNAVPGELLVRITPTRVIFKENIAS
jgi:PPOX class probable F420-dependent enzyme